MKKLIWTPKFIKESDKFIKKFPDLINAFKECILKLEQDPFSSSLKTHKLKGTLNNCYSSSINFKFRIVFEFSENNEAIVLLNIGSHDEVY